MKTKVTEITSRYGQMLKVGDPVSYKPSVKYSGMRFGVLVGITDRGGDKVSYTVKTIIRGYEWDRVNKNTNYWWKFSNVNLTSSVPLLINFESTAPEFKDAWDLYFNSLKDDVLPDIDAIDRDAWPTGWNRFVH